LKAKSIRNELTPLIFSLTLFWMGFLMDAKWMGGFYYPQRQKVIIYYNKKIMILMSAEILRKKIIFQ